MAELKDRWENRLVLNKLNIAEDYVRGNLCIILEGKSGTGRRAIDGERFSSTDPRGASAEIGEAASYLSPVTDQYQLGNGRRMDNWGQGGVLVLVVQTVSHIEEVPRASGERLKRLEQIFDGRGWCLYSVTQSFVTRPVSSFGEIELCVLSAAIKPDQFPHDVVKGAPQVVDSVAYNQSDARGRLKDRDVNIQCPIVSMIDRGIKIVSSELAELPFQVSDVMIGPFDL
jgi:hypothetical protein